MNLYEAIFKRKSIRNYDMNKLDEQTMKEIEDYLHSIKPYKDDIKIETYFINDESQISGMWKVKAPHYIAITSEKKEDYLVNAGYILEMLVLYLTAKGIGTCWLGGTKPIGKMDKNNEVIVMLAFGKASEPLYRQNISEFNRKDVDGISNLYETNEIMEAIRVAPSAMNKQSWYFHVINSTITAYHKSVPKLMERMTVIDMGIALAHMKIATENLDNKVIFQREEYNKIKGYEYIATCKIF